MQVPTNAPKVDRSFTADYEFGATLAESMELFGEEVIHSLFVKSAVVALQALVRGKLEAGEDETAILEAVNEWKPEARAATKPRRTKTEVILDKVASMSSEERQAILAKLQQDVE